MIIQSKKVWVVNTWLEAQIEVEDGKSQISIHMVQKRLMKTMVKNVSFQVLLMYIHMVRMDLIQMTRKKKVYVLG